MAVVTIYPFGQSASIGGVGYIVVSTLPAIFAVVSMEEWPKWVKPTGAHDDYEKGARVSHNGRHWASDYDANVCESGVFGWTII